MTHNGTGHVALYVALGIDWNAAYGINALKDFCLLGDKMTTATFKTKAERDAHLAEYRRLKAEHHECTMN